MVFTFMAWDGMKDAEFEKGPNWTQPSFFIKE